MKSEKFYIKSEGTFANLRKISIKCERSTIVINKIKLYCNAGGRGAPRRGLAHRRPPPGSGENVPAYICI